jgi:hypothetical protein
MELINDINNFDLLPDEHLIEIALHINIEEIKNYCTLNNRFNNLVCQNNWFWYSKLKFDYNNHLNYDINIKWYNAYMKFSDVLVFGLNTSGQLGLGDKSVK